MKSIMGRNGGSMLSKESANIIKPVTEEQSEYMSSNNGDQSGTSSGPKSETSSSSFAIAKSETQMLRYSKLLIVSLIAGIAIAASILTYQFVRKQEDDEYHAKVRYTTV
jgi:hypothetical protein